MSTRRIKEEGTETVRQEPVAEIATEVPTVQTTNEPQTNSLIYLGPNLPGGRLLQSTVFRGGIPVYLQPLLTEQPDVATLLVPVTEISEVQTRIVQTGTPEYGAYQSILKGGIPDGV